MNYTVIVNTEGTTHTYACTSRADAELLFKAMCVYVLGSVALWQGSRLIASN